MIGITELFCGAVFLFGLFYTWSLWRYGYWKRKGVEGPKPEILFGNIKESVLVRKHIGFVLHDLYLKTNKLPYVGIFNMFRRALIVNDLDLIKTILVKDFAYFTDRHVIINAKTDPLALHLVNLTGETWKNMRTKLTPTFTTSKMKYMFETMARCSEEMSAYLEKNVAVADNTCSMDVKELFSKLNTDIIGSCAFGIECNTFKNPDQKFRKVGRSILNPSFFKAILRTSALFFPAFNKLLNISFFEKEDVDFLLNTVRNTIKYRKENNVTRNDFLQLLINLKADEDDTSGEGLTTMQIAAQVFVFFVAGFETSATTAGFALYELALNPDVQDTLRKEIDEVLEKHGGKATYEALAEMNYLTQTIDETFRKYPPFPVILRNCTKNYTLPGTDIMIEQGTAVMVPVLGIHRDPEIYPDPMKFDPERFTPENKASRHHCAHLPFGEGPRNCIASRFGMLQTRLGLVTLLSKYEVSPNDETPIPMVYRPKSVVLGVKEGLSLKITKRTQKI